MYRYIVNIRGLEPRLRKCVPGSIPGPGVICGLSLLLVLYSAPRGFSPGTPVSPSPQKPTFLDVRHFSHEPLARVIAQALPVLDVKFHLHFYIYISNKREWNNCFIKNPSKSWRTKLKWK